MTVAMLLGSVVVLVLAAELFTNAVEWLGHRLKLSDGAVGRILAAVGTALPETLIPLVAIIGGGAGSHTIGVGAILGAPFMLSTLALFLSGMATLAFRGVRHAQLTADATTVRRDLGWFLAMFSSLLLGTAVPPGWPRGVLAAGLLAGYALYVRQTMGGPAQDHPDLRRLYLGGYRPRMSIIAIQLVVALTVLVLAAHFFVGAVKEVAILWNVPLLALSLLIVPIATELPEKVNSVLWIRRGKDTLALGNITGAMVFQAAIPGAVGLLLTDWALEPLSWLTAAFALCSAALVCFWLTVSRRLPAAALLPGGAFYVAYAGVVVLT
jgi:cation:H+ antiporter